MNKILKFKISDKVLWIALTILVIPTFFSIIRPGYYSMHDDIQAFRIHQMDKCFQDLQFPCRWVPDMGYQYGYPQFNYYPPSVYYLGELVHLLGFQFIDSVKVIVILGYLLSAWFMFLFLKEWLGKYPAFIGSLLYTYSPYKSVDTYVRGALSEFWALVFFPLIFWAGLKLIREEKIKYVGFLALSIGLLLLTHNLMSFIFLPIFGIWILCMVWLEKKWRVLPKIILGGVLGLCFAATFTLPVLLEKQYVHLDSIISGYFDYRLHFTTINELFISNYWGYGSSVWGIKDELSLSTGQIHWILGVLALGLALVNFKKYKKLSIITFLLGGLDIFVLLMTHNKSVPIWSAFSSVLAYIQFPWRFLSDSIFLLSVLGGVAIYFINEVNRKLALILGAIVIFGMFLMYGSFFQPHSWSNITDNEKFSGKSWEKQLTISIFDYLPIYAELPPPSKAPEVPEVMDGQAQFSYYNKGSYFQFGEVNVLSDRANLRLPLFDFPGMEVKVDGKKVVFWHDDCRNQKYCMGLISFDVDKGYHSIEAKLTDTPIRLLGNLLSVFSLIIIFVVIFKDFKQRKK